MDGTKTTEHSSELLSIRMLPSTQKVPNWKGAVSNVCCCEESIMALIRDNEIHGYGWNKHIICLNADNV